MVAASASESVCASTAASPAAAPVGTSQSAPKPLPPATRALNETTTVAGGRGAANVVIIDEETGEDGTCTAAVEPPAKRQKKSTSEVWNFYTKFNETVKRDHYSIFIERHEKKGVIEDQRWAKCSRCNYRTPADPKNGTSHLWNHLRYTHHYNRELNQFQDPQIGEGGANAQIGEGGANAQIGEGGANANADMGEVLNADNP